MNPNNKKLQQTWRCFSAFFLPPLLLILPSLPTSLFLPFLSLFSFFFTFSPSLSPLLSLLSDFDFSLAFFCVIIEQNAVRQLTLKSVPVKISTCQLSLTPLHKLWSLTRLLTYSYLIFMFILSLLHEKVQHHIISPSSSSKSWRQSFPGSGWSISSWGPPPPPGWRPRHHRWTGGREWLPGSGQLLHLERGRQWQCRRIDDKILIEGFVLLIFLLSSLLELEVENRTREFLLAADTWVPRQLGHRGGGRGVAQGGRGRGARGRWRRWCRRWGRWWWTWWRKLPRLLWSACATHRRESKSGHQDLRKTLKIL